MASVKQYTLQLWDIQATTAAKLGSDIRSASMQLRAALLAVDVTIAVVLKLLVDNGTITDAQLVSAANAAKNLTFPTLPLEVTMPEDGSPIPPPDLT